MSYDNLLDNVAVLPSALKPIYPRDFYDLLHIGRERAHRAMQPYAVCKKRGDTRARLQFGTARYVGGTDPDFLHNPRKTVDPRTFANQVRMEDGELFFSVNEIDGRRQTERLRAVHGWWLDIDAKGGQFGDYQREYAIFEDIAKVLDESGLPTPHAFVNTRSGGWHIYWLADPIYRAPYTKTPLLKEWKAVATTIVRKFSSAKAALKRQGLLNPDPKMAFSVDGGASKDAVRVMRLPSSVRFAWQTKANGACYRDTSHGYGVLPYTHIDSPTERYDYAQFCSLMGVDATAQNYQEAAPALEREAKPEKQRGTVTPNVTPMFTAPTGGRNAHWNTAYNILTNWMTSVGNVPAGHRNNTAFALYNCLLRRMPLERARAAIQRLNNQHIGLDSADLKRALCGAEQPCSTGRRYRYNYSASGLGAFLEDNFPFLNVSEHSVFTTTKKRLRSAMPVNVRKQAEAAEYAAKAAAGKTTAKKKAVSTLHQRLLPAARQIVERGEELTQTAVAREAGYKSRATVARQWQAILAAFEGGKFCSKSKPTETREPLEPPLLLASGGGVSFASGIYTPPPRIQGRFEGCKYVKFKPPI